LAKNFHFSHICCTFADFFDKIVHKTLIYADNQYKTRIDQSDGGLRSSGEDDWLCPNYGRFA
jgi:hypothetical protein